MGQGFSPVHLVSFALVNGSQVSPSRSRRRIYPLDESLHGPGGLINCRGKLEVIQPLQRTRIDLRPVRQRRDPRWPRMLSARLEYRDARAARRQETGIRQQPFEKLQVHQVVGAVVDS